MDPEVISTAAPISLHAEVFNFPELDDSTRHLVEGAQGVFQLAVDGLTSIVMARNAAKDDPSLNEAAVILKTQELADRKVAEYSKAYDKVYAQLASQIASHKAELAKPLEATAIPSVASELRAMFRSMSKADQNAAITTALAEGDRVLLGSILSAHRLLTGLSEIEVQVHTQKFNEKSQPLVSKRLAVLQHAYDLMGERGGIMTVHAQKNVGADRHKVRALQNAAAKTAKAFA